MKIRTDFVTNSSSSNFILGTPGQKSGLTIDDISCALQALYFNISNTFRYMENKLTKNRVLWDKIQKSRHYYKVYTDNHIKFPESTTIAFFEKSSEICEFIRDSMEFKTILQEATNKYLKGFEYNNIKYELANHFIMYKSVIDLEPQIKDLKSNLFSIDTLDKDKLKILLKDNGYSTEVESLKQEALDKLGEFIIFSDNTCELLNRLLLEMR